MKKASLKLSGSGRRKSTNLLSKVVASTSWTGQPFPDGCSEAIIGPECNILPSDRLQVVNVSMGRNIIHLTHVIESHRCN